LSISIVLAQAGSDPDAGEVLVRDAHVLERTAVLAGAAVIRARDLLLHPIALAAIAVLVANDHRWKASHPGWLTGKLSDVAGYRQRRLTA
jgi:hypothetical protein